ncbi:erythromycin esterase [Actinopolyspora biskrensis]|uniref:Erythromycin esterase n=2 Tax=Actinopolyspora biskrensis TaxID=1470178 RepID=A0A852Z5R0_9ACTN|nr:erythromycin esterase [Actinopolyspora biskrensis]
MSRSATPLSDWFGEHTSTLRGFDVDAPLDDLEPLRDIVGDAQVVALGEGAHFVGEFTHARQRMLRFLAERCGFTVVAFEFGFSEAAALDHWLQGHGDDADLATVGGTTNAGVNPQLVHWLRRHNSTSAHPLRFVGVDTPTAGGQLRPALEPLADYLREVDPDLVGLVERALAIADRFTGTSVAVAAPKWAQLDGADQDALTASLTRLLLRFRSLEPLYVSRSDQAGYDLALRHLEAALHADYMFTAMRDLFAGRGLDGDAAVRDHYMAESLHWHLDRAEPGTRIALAAHNNHIQKTPVYFDDELAVLPMGYYLHRTLGDSYRALAQTHTAEHVVEMHPTEEAEAGFTVTEERLGTPEPGSVEAAVIDAGYGTDISLTNLRNAPSEGLDRIRAQGSSLPIPVPQAFDAVLTSPTTTTYYTTSLHSEQ